MPDHSYSEKHHQQVGGKPGGARAGEVARVAGLSSGESVEVETLDGLRAAREP